MYHFPLAVILDPAKPPLARLLHSVVAAKLLFVIFSFFLNLGVAAASSHWIEAPVMRLKDRFKYA